MRDFFQSNTDFLATLKYFHQEYINSVQGSMQLYINDDQKNIFEQAIYCFLTPATKSDSAEKTYNDLFFEDYFYKASEKEIAQCLRKPPYIRFHNQKARRLFWWREHGGDIIKYMLDLHDAFQKREFLVKNVTGLHYKESTHFLRNIGMSDNLVILDRHILNFMRDVQLLPDNFNQLSKNYLKWEKLFQDFVNSSLWINTIGESSIPQADFAIWAASVKRADPKITHERILQLK